MKNKEAVAQTVNVKEERRRFKKKLVEMQKKAREDLLPFCRKCFKDDFDKGQIKSLKSYTNGKLLKEEIIREKNINKSNYMEPIGVMRDYVCENDWDEDEEEGKKHYISVEVLRNELGEDYFKKGKKKSSKD